MNSQHMKLQIVVQSGLQIHLQGVLLPSSPHAFLAGVSDFHGCTCHRYKGGRDISRHIGDVCAACHVQDSAEVGVAQAMMPLFKSGGCKEGRC